MSALSTAERPLHTPAVRPMSRRRGKRLVRRDRIEAGVILGAFALAFAFFGSQSSTAAPEWSWANVETTPINHSLAVGAWTPLGAATDVSGEETYRFCVTAQGTGTMLMSPTSLMSSVTLTGTGPVTSCADTFRVTAVAAVQPSATVADPASDITIIDASWQRLVVDGE